MEKTILREISALLKPIFEKYGILRAVVFGSLARGESTRRSDLDLMLVQETDKRFLDRYDGILCDITDVVRGRDVDLLIYTPGELESMSNRAFIKRIIKDGIVIYESNRQQISS